MKYIVRVPELHYPMNPNIIRRILGGENLPMSQRGSIRHAVEGDVVDLDHLPKKNVDGYLKAGWIEEVSEEKEGGKK